MSALLATPLIDAVLFFFFAVWWRWALPRRLGNLPTLEDFHHAVARPFGLLYVINFAAHLAIAWELPHPWRDSPLAQFLFFGLGSIVTTWFFQTMLVYPWHKRLAGTRLAPFLQAAFAYTRLTVALLAPFFIYQLLNAALFDVPLESVDAVEILVFNVGRVVVLSLLTVVFSTMFMLRMIPNSPVRDPEYLELIGKRLNQAGWGSCRLRWIDLPEFNNAFVAGFKWFGFSNQTMFIGRSLRDLLDKEEFDAVISHELGHMANGHLLKRITWALFLVLGLALSLVASVVLSILASLAFGDDPRGIALVFGASLLITLVGSYLCLVGWLFRLYRAQEHEADAFAVMRLGIKLEDLERSLRKVARKFRKHARTPGLWRPFRTHPEIEARIQNVRSKMDRGVDFDWNPSLVSRLLEMTVRVASPRALAGGFALFMLAGLMTHTRVQQNRHYLSLVGRGDLAALRSFEKHSSHINSRQYLLVGITPLEMAVHSADLATVKFLMAQGADPTHGSGFSSPLDMAMNRGRWEILDYLLGQMPSAWMKVNAARLFRAAVKEESGKAFSLLTSHQLERWVPRAEMAELKARIKPNRLPSSEAISK